MCNWKRISVIGLALGVACPAVLAVGSPNANTQYGSPGIFGYDARDLSFPNPGFPDTYGVRRDSFGALRDADMMPDNMMIGAVSGQYQDIGIRKQLPYPYNMGGYEIGLGGTPYPGVGGFPYPANGFSNTGSGFSNAFNSYGRGFQTSAAASLLPNGYYGSGFSGNGVDTSTVANESGAGSLGLASGGYAIQPAGNLGLVARNVVLQPGAKYTVVNPLSGSPAQASIANNAGSPFGNYGLTNPLSGQANASSPHIVAGVGTQSFSGVGVPTATASPWNVRIGTNTRMALTSSAVPFMLANNAAQGFSNPTIASQTTGLSGQANFVPTGSTRNLSNQAAVSALNNGFNRGLVVGSTSITGSPVAGSPIAMAPQSNFSSFGTIPNSGTNFNNGSALALSQERFNNVVTLNSIGANFTSPVQNVPVNGPTTQFSSPNNYGNPSIATIGTTNFTSTAPSSVNTGIQFATPGQSNFSPIVNPTAAQVASGIRQSTTAPSNAGLANGTTSNIGTYGNRNSTSTPIASVTGSPFSATAPGRVPTANQAVQAAGPYPLTGPTGAGFNPSAIAGGFGGALVPSAGGDNTNGDTTQQRRMVYPMFAPNAVPPRVQPAQILPRPQRQNNYALAMRSTTGNMARNTIAARPPVTSANNNSSQRARRPAPSMSQLITQSIGTVTGSITDQDGRCVLFGTRGTAREMPNNNVVLTLHDGSVVPIGNGASTIKQIAQSTQLSL